MTVKHTSVKLLTVVSGDMTRHFFLHAVNVHQGGGASLLRALLEVLPVCARATALLDTRMLRPDSLGDSVDIKRVPPSIRQRFEAERWLVNNVEAGDFVLCFGNLPPLFRLAGRTLVFVQNRFVIDLVRLDNFSLKTRLRLRMERLWFCWKAANVHAFIVQTPSMRTILEASGVVAGKPVYVLPFVSISEGYQRSLDQGPSKGLDNSFIYVASGEPHKNHRNLVQAWCLLAQEGLFPRLLLTLDAKINSELCGWIDQQIHRFGLRLENLGVQPHEQIKHLYAQVQALIYPSTFESFGLPLIEARQAGLAVVASELDFVRDVLDPEQVFDPQSPVSIARAVKRFMGSSEKPLPLLNAAEFLRNVLEKCE